MIGHLRLAGCLAMTLAALTACAGASAPAQVTVFAASSLQGAFIDLAHDFEAAHPGVRVRLSFDGSGALVDQLSGGAPADVLATADEASLQRAQSSGLVGHGTTFATNTLVLIVPANNPAQVSSLSHLAGHKLVICAASVPCGAATQRLAARLGVSLHPVSEESKVGDVRGKVESGEADAGVVYRTDAIASGARVQTFPIDGAASEPNRYPIALVAHSSNVWADPFVRWVTGPEGRTVLDRYGFGRP